MEHMFEKPALDKGLYECKLDVDNKYCKTLCERASVAMRNIASANGVAINMQMIGV